MNQVYYFTSLSKFKLLSNSQNLLFVSLFSRLKVVNNVPILVANNHFSGLKKLQIVFNLRKITFSRKFFSFYVFNKSGVSKFFRIPDIYLLLFCNLFNLSIIPYLEYFYSRFSFGFRPFRLNHDAFDFIKNTILSSKNGNSYFSTTKFNISNSHLFFNNTLLKKIYLFNKFASYTFLVDILSSSNISNLFDSFLNYSMIGLVFKIDYILRY